MPPNMRKVDHTEDLAKYVDDLLAKDMLKLSVRDRNDIQEEIHGVKCLAVHESPELVRRSLKELTEEIDKIPDAEKRAYLKSMKLLPDNSEGNSTRNSNSTCVNDIRRQAPTPTTRLSYIHKDDFKLRFLRCDLFDIAKAARRLVTYLDLLLEIFGEDALKRPPSIMDFTKDELKHFRKGMIQILPYRDRSGRRVILCFPEEEESQIPPFVKAKIAMYKLWCIGENDPVTQQKGFVVLVWFDSAFAMLSSPWKIKYKFYTLNCDRSAALHICSPDTPHYRFRRALTSMRAGEENRLKLVFHLGESMEIHYNLQGYGIPFEHVPISWTGKVKTQYLKQWMRIRQAIEENDTSGFVGGSSDEDSVLSSSNIIECPQLQDVVFRQGTSGTSHPGNVSFRSLIESIVLNAQYEYEQSLANYQRAKETEAGNLDGGVDEPRSKRDKHKPKNRRPKQLSFDIYDERQRTSSEKSRYLVWNNENGWWNELTDKEQICLKIEYMVREFQKCLPKRLPLAASKSRSKQRSSPNHNRKKHPSGGIIQPSQRHDSVGSDGSEKKNVVFLQSETTIFTGQQNSGNIFFANKRQRLGNFVNVADEGGTSSRDTSNNSTIDSDLGNSEMECFGMRFTPCIR